jgi:hypothetical protein
MIRPFEFVGRQLRMAAGVVLENICLTGGRVGDRIDDRSGRAGEVPF